MWPPAGTCSILVGRFEADYVRREQEVEELASLAVNGVVLRFHRVMIE